MGSRAEGLPLSPGVWEQRPEGLPPAGACAYLHAVLLHRPSQGVHSLPANQDAQVNQQHAPDDHKQFLVLDDLQRGRERHAVRVRERTSQTEVRGRVRERRNRVTLSGRIS